MSELSRFLFILKGIHTIQRERETDSCLEVEQGDGVSGVGGGGRLEEEEHRGEHGHQ